VAERLTLISFVGGESGYGAVLGGDAGSAAIRADGESAVGVSCDDRPGDARVSVGDGDGGLDVSWTPAGPMLEFAIGDDGVRVHAIAASLTGESGPLSGPGVLWDLPAGGHSAIRTAWAATAQSALTVLIATRAEDSREHGEEIVGAARIIPGAEPFGYAEPLISTEYDAAGAHTRATLELWQAEDDRAPARGAGTRIAGSSLSLGSARLEAARFRWGLEGAAAVGAYEILTP
jgi:hypothetical protein